MRGLLDWGRRLYLRDAWTDTYALGRSLLALGPLTTLVFNDAHLLFHPSAAWTAPHCEGPAATFGLFCVLPAEPARWLGILLLTLVVVGWHPRWTAVPHWWVAFSLQASISLPEGGDQLAAGLALLLVPVALLDGRRWVWARTADGLPLPGTTGRMVANSSLAMARLQVSVVYLNAAVAKFAVPDWADGTAVHYWMLDPVFGPGGLRGAIATALTSTTVGVVGFTWGTMLLELVLAYGLVASRSYRRVTYVAGVGFHAGIALLLSLMSFGITMVGALTLYLVSAEDVRAAVVTTGRRLRRVRERLRPSAPAEEQVPVPRQAEETV